MALISCPECQRQISDLARFCPGCGCPIAEGTMRQAPPPVQAQPQVQSPQSVKVAPAPPVVEPTTEPTDPEALREMLLRDLANVSLRKRYLAVRTPALKQRDRDSRPVNLELFLQIVAGSIGVGLFPLVLLIAISFLVGMAILRSQDRMPGVGAEQLGRMFGHGIFIAVVLGFISGFFALIYFGIVSVRLRNRCEELGPLPDDAPPNSAQARKRFLGE